MTNQIDSNMLLSRKSIGQSAPLAIGILFAVISVAQVAYRCAWIPIQEKRKLVANLERKMETLESERREEEHRIEVWFGQQAKSFASDPAVLAHNYQQWLLQRTRGIPGIHVHASTPVREGEIGSRVEFSIEGNANVEWLAGFIEEIENTPLMHQITYVDIDSAARTRGNLAFKLHFTALALDGAESQTSWPTSVARARPLGLTGILAKSQPFKQGYTGPPPRLASTPRRTYGPKPKPKTQSKSKPKVDPLRLVELFGSVRVAGEPQAWIVDKSTDRELILREDDELELYGFRAKVSFIGREKLALLTTGGSEIQWPLGTALRSVVSE